VIDRLADAVVALQKRENTTIPFLQKQLDDINKRIENLIDSIEQGISADDTLSFFMETMPDVPFIQSDIIIEYAKKKDMASRARELCALYVPDNIIQSARLVLADWEDLRLAPAEADLFIHAWHPHGGLLLEAYSAARPGYQINHDLLRFYVLRRRIEDIWVDILRLTNESPSEDETAKLLGWIGQSIDAINAIMK